MPNEVKRIVILFSKLSGYILACLKELKMRHEIELLVFHWETAEDAPFDFGKLDWVDFLYSREKYSAHEIDKMVRAFNPHGMYISGWMDRDYIKIARKVKKEGIPTIAALDGQWDGNLRQHLGSWLAPFYLHSAIDVLWVTGERQSQFAKKLGYAGRKCWYGLYCCDWEKFSCHSFKLGEMKDGAFLYVGRYVPEKGIEELVEAYRVYRDQANDPWELICAGVGRMRHLLSDQEGIFDVGFTQPDDLPLLMRNKATAFILPSRKEPWGVVLQEAAASGLPLISSDACGAAVHLLQDEYNGFLFESGNSMHLSNCMMKMTNTLGAIRAEMGERSYELSKQFTPQRWADTLVNGLKAFS